MSASDIEEHFNYDLNEYIAKVEEQENEWLNDYNNKASRHHY